MKKEYIGQLLEKYWGGETSLEEEKEIKNYFTSENIPEEHRVFIPLFRYFHEEASLVMTKELKVPVQNKVRRLNTRTFLGIAAAILFMLGFYYYISETRVVPENKYVLEDTYDTPEEAYTEVKKALMYVSSKMNKGVSTTVHSLEKIEPLDDILN